MDGQESRKWLLKNAVENVTLFRDHAMCGGRRRRCGRDGKCEPAVPPGRASRPPEFRVSLEIDVPLEAFAERKDVAELRPDAEHLRPEAPDPVARAAVAPKFLVGVPYQPHLHLLGQELRCAPVEMHVHAALVLRRQVEKVVRESEYRRKFV